MQNLGGTSLCLVTRVWWRRYQQTHPPLMWKGEGCLELFPVLGTSQMFSHSILRTPQWIYYPLFTVERNRPLSGKINPKPIGALWLKAPTLEYRIFQVNLNTIIHHCKACHWAIWSLSFLTCQLGATWYLLQRVLVKILWDSAHKRLNTVLNPL